MRRCKPGEERDGAHEVTVAGHPHRLFVWPGPSRCGGTCDGVTFEFGRKGVWVIDFAELERVYRLAKQARLE